MRAEVPLALLPAHRCRVERGEERRRALRRGCRLQVVGEHISRAPTEVDLDGSDGGERGARVTSGPAGPPPDVRLGRRAERGQPAAEELGLRGGGVELLDRPAEPVLRRDPAELRADPRPARPPADQPPLHRHLREHAGAGALLDLPLAGAEAQLLREQRHVARHLGRHCLPPRRHGGDGGIPCPRDPRARPGRDAALAHETFEPLPLRRGDRFRCGGEDDRDELARHHPERPAHREHADETPLVVERPLDVGRHDALAACLDGEEYRDGVGRMQADE